MTFRRMISLLMVLVFGFSAVIPPAGAQVFQPTSNFAVPSGFRPPVLIGLKIHPENPLLFDFIVDQGQAKLSPEELKSETEKLVKYFFAALAIPDDEVWVNLSPVEKDRVIPEVLGQTVMGKAMLEQDLVLKKLAASLTNPDEPLGQDYWKRVRRELQAKLGTSDVPVDSFNKVWIVPANAEVLESPSIVLVGEKRLKVMMADDYEAMKTLEEQPASESVKISSAVFKDTVLPEIEREVNEGEKFAAVRQMYNSAILAAWFKKTLKESLLGKIYTDKNKVAGVTTDDKEIKQKVQEQYLETLQKGIYNFIKEDIDEATGEMIPRKYFSGGIMGKIPLSGRSVSNASQEPRIEAINNSATGVVIATGLATEGTGDLAAAGRAATAAQAAVADAAAGRTAEEVKSETVQLARDFIDQLKTDVIRLEDIALGPREIYQILDGLTYFLPSYLNDFKKLQPSTAESIDEFLEKIQSAVTNYRDAVRSDSAAGDQRVRLITLLNSLKDDFLLHIGGLRNEDINLQIAPAIEEVVEALKAQGITLERNPVTGQWKVREYVETADEKRVEFTLNNEPGEIKIDDGYLLYRHSIFRGLGHGGRNLKSAYGDSEDILRHEKVEIQDAFDFADRNQINYAQVGLGAALRYWGNGLFVSGENAGERDESVNDQEIIRRQTALRQLEHDAHQKGLVAEGAQKETVAKIIKPFKSVIPYFDIFISATGPAGAIMATGDGLALDQNLRINPQAQLSENILALMSRSPIEDIGTWREGLIHFLHDEFADPQPQGKTSRFIERQPNGSLVFDLQSLYEALRANGNYTPEQIIKTLKDALLDTRFIIRYSMEWQSIAGVPLRGESENILEARPRLMENLHQAMVQYRDSIHVAGDPSIPMGIDLNRTIWSLEKFITFAQESGQWTLNYDQWSQLTYWDRDSYFGTFFEGTGLNVVSETLTDQRLAELNAITAAAEEDMRSFIEKRESVLGKISAIRSTAPKSAEQTIEKDREILQSIRDLEVELYELMDLSSQLMPEAAANIQEEKEKIQRLVKTYALRVKWRNTLEAFKTQNTLIGELESLVRLIFNRIKVPTDSTSVVAAGEGATAQRAGGETSEQGMTRRRLLGFGFFGAISAVASGLNVPSPARASERVPSPKSPAKGRAVPVNVILKAAEETIRPKGIQQDASAYDRQQLMNRGFTETEAAIIIDEQKTLMDRFAPDWSQEYRNAVLDGISRLDKGVSLDTSTSLFERGGPSIRIKNIEDISAQNGADREAIFRALVVREIAKVIFAEQFDAVLNAPGKVKAPLIPQAIVEAMAILRWSELGKKERFLTARMGWWNGSGSDLEKTGASLASKAAKLERAQKGSGWAYLADRMEHLDEVRDNEFLLHEFFPMQELISGLAGGLTTAAVGVVRGDTSGPAGAGALIEREAINQKSIRYNDRIESSVRQFATMLTNIGLTVYRDSKGFRGELGFRELLERTGRRNISFSMARQWVDKNGDKQSKENVTTELELLTLDDGSEALVFIDPILFDGYDHVGLNRNAIYVSRRENIPHEKTVLENGRKFARENKIDIENQPFGDALFYWANEEIPGDDATRTQLRTRQRDVLQLEYDLHQQGLQIELGDSYTIKTKKFDVLPEVIPDLRIFLAGTGTGDAQAPQLAVARIENVSHPARSDFNEMGTVQVTLARQVIDIGNKLVEIEELRSAILMAGQAAGVANINDIVDEILAVKLNKSSLYELLTTNPKFRDQFMYNLPNTLDNIKSDYFQNQANQARHAMEILTQTRGSEEAAKQVYETFRALEYERMRGFGTEDQRLLDILSNRNVIDEAQKDLDRLRAQGLGTVPAAAGQGAPSKPGAITVNGDPINLEQNIRINMAIRQYFGSGNPVALTDSELAIVDKANVLKKDREQNSSKPEVAVFVIPELSQFNDFLMAHPGRGGEQWGINHTLRQIYMSPERFELLKKLSSEAQEQFWRHEIAHIDNPTKTEGWIQAGYPVGSFLREVGSGQGATAQREGGEEKQFLINTQRAPEDIVDFVIIINNDLESLLRLIKDVYSANSSRDNRSGLNTAIDYAKTKSQQMRDRISSQSRRIEAQSADRMMQLLKNIETELISIESRRPETIDIVKFRSTLVEINRLLQQLANGEAPAAAAAADAAGQAATAQRDGEAKRNLADEISNRIQSAQKGVIANFSAQIQEVSEVILDPERSESFKQSQFSMLVGSFNIMRDEIFSILNSLDQVAQKDPRMKGYLDSSKSKIRSPIGSIKGFLDHQRAIGYEAFFTELDQELTNLNRLLKLISSAQSAQNFVDAQTTATQAPLTPGGIDFDPTNMNLQIKRNGKGVPLPVSQQNLDAINIDGIYPVIINIVPINAQNLPILLGLAPKDPANREEKQLALI